MGVESFGVCVRKRNNEKSGLKFDFYSFVLRISRMDGW